MARVDSRMKMAVIAGAAEAMKCRASDSKKSDDEVIRNVASRVDEILGNIDY